MMGRLFVDGRRSRQGELRLPIPLPVTKTRPVEPDSRIRKIARKGNLPSFHFHQHDRFALFNSGFSIDASVRITLLDRDVPSYF